MLMRISLIVAILAAIGAGTLNILQVRDHITTLISQRDDYHTQLTQTQATLDTTKKDLAKTKSDLSDTKQQLADSKSAQKKAEDTAATQQKRADDLADQLAKATADRDAAQANLAAYKATGKSPQEILQLVDLIKKNQDTINALNDEGRKLSREIARLQGRLDALVGSNSVVYLRADLKGAVAVVDPKWDFVVLNIGYEQEPKLENGELLVSRNGKLVAKVIVTTVEKSRCIANIVPGWKLGDVCEGDIVTPANPAT